MKQIDHIDSLTHLDFPNAIAKERREKFGSFLLAAFGLIGLFAINSPVFSYSNSGSIEQQKSAKSWLTSASLNAEKTALNSSLIPSPKAGQQVIVSAKTAAAKVLN